MKSTIIPHLNARGQQRLRAMAAAIVALAVLLLGLGTAPVAAQTGTPPAQSPQQNAAPPAQNTPAATNTTNTTSPAASTDPLAPGAVIAQGLVYLDGSTQVWEVVEQKPPGLSSAQSATNGPAFLFQRSGATIVRNDVTSKRARLEASEGYYESAGDPYTAWADSSSSTYWNFQMVAPSDVAKNAFYQSPEMKGLAAGTYDLELTRFVMQPGDSVQLPDHTGPALVMTFSGQINVSISGSAGALSAGDGQLVTGAGSVNNAGNQKAGFVFIALGDKVSDQQPQNSATRPATTTTTTTTATNTPVSTTSNAPSANAPSANATIAPTSQAAPAQQSTIAATQAPSGSQRTSIAVTAQADIYVEVTADGVMMFQGNLATGQTTGQIAGSTFTVYTSSGVNTLFTNSCGTEFLMGNEQGEATYYLQAGPDSCPPSV